MKKERENRQHLCPKSIGKLIGVPKYELDRHIIYIPAKIHANEDHYVPQVLLEIREAKKEGIFVELEDVLRMRKKGWFRA